MQTGTKRKAATAAGRGDSKVRRGEDEDEDEDDNDGEEAHSRSRSPSPVDSDACSADDGPPAGSMQAPYSSSGSAALSGVQCRLETKELWDQFHDLGTEMIITKSGRLVNIIQ